MRDVAERPATKTRQSSSTAAPSVTEVEQLDEDEAMVGASGAQRVDQTLKPESRLAKVCEIIIAEQPGLTSS